MAEDVTWCGVSAWGRLASGHRWGLYRWPVAVGVMAVAVAGLEAALGWVGSGFGVMIGLAALWFLPGPRVCAGFTEDGVVARGWVFRRERQWSDVDLLRLGMVSGTITMGGYPGIAAVAGNRELRLQRWIGRPEARSDGLGSLITSARAHGVHVLLEPTCEYAFPDTPVDQVGLLQRVDGVLLPKTQAARITSRGATAAVCILGAIAAAGAGAMAGRLNKHQGGVVSLGGLALFSSGVILVEMVPLWRWTQARSARDDAGVRRP